METGAARSSAHSVQPAVEPKPLLLPSNSGRVGGFSLAVSIFPGMWGGFDFSLFFYYFVSLALASPINLIYGWHELVSRLDILTKANSPGTPRCLGRDAHSVSGS